MIYATVDPAAGWQKVLRLRWAAQCYTYHFGKAPWRLAIPWNSSTGLWSEQ